MAAGDRRPNRTHRVRRRNVPACPGAGTAVDRCRHARPGACGHGDHLAPRALPLVDLRGRAAQGITAPLRHIRRSLPVGLATWVSRVKTNIDVIMLGAMATSRAVGYYSASVPARLLRSDVRGPVRDGTAAEGRSRAERVREEAASVVVRVSRPRWSSRAALSASLHRCLLRSWCCCSGRASGSRSCTDPTRFLASAALVTSLSLGYAGSVSATTISMRRRVGCGGD